MDQLPSRKTPRSGAGADRDRLRTGLGLGDDLMSRWIGIALIGQRPSFHLTAAQAWGVTSAALVGWALALEYLSAAFAAGRIWTVAAVPAIALCQLALVGRLRVQQVTVAHHAIHGSFLDGDQRVNRLIAAIATLITFAQNPVAYRRDHVGHHRPAVFTSPEDADAAFLLQLGFRQGMNEREAWRRLAATLVSPRFHFIFLMARLRSNLVDAGPARRLASALWLAALAWATFALGPLVGTLTVILPWGPLYHASALLQFASEHRWLSGPPPNGDAAEYCRRSQARVALAPLPPIGLRGLPWAYAWLRWLFAQSLENLFRLAVTVADLPVHDFHHAQGLLRRRVRDWPQLVFERQAAIDAGDVLCLADREARGWRQALRWALDGLAAQPSSNH